MLLFAPPAYFDRMGTITSPTDGSAQGRIQAWSGGIGMAVNNPVFGVGAGQFSPRGARRRIPATSFCLPNWASPAWLSSSCWCSATCMPT